MKRSVNEIIINKIQESISPNEKIVTYLMDKLSIGRESAYRRIRDQIPFTFEEVIKLAEDIGFSVDNIISKHRSDPFLIEISPHFTNNSHDSFIGGFICYYDFLLRMQKSNKRDVIMVINRLTPTYVFSQTHLIKFYYYKWMRQFSYLPVDIPYSEVTIPAEVTELISKISDVFFKLEDFSCTCILDQNIYLDILKEIQYYYRRKVISKEDLALIKKDFMDMFFIIEEMILNGTKYNHKHRSYISMHALEATCLHFTLDDEEIASFTPCSLFPMWTSNKDLCRLIKQWIDSLKKHSAFITNSNEYVQSSFIKKQYEYINSYLSEDSKDPIFAFMNE